MSPLGAGRLETATQKTGGCGMGSHVVKEGVTGWNNDPGSSKARGEGVLHEFRDTLCDGTDTDHRFDRRSRLDGGRAAHPTGHRVTHGPQRATCRGNTSSCRQQNTSWSASSTALRHAPVSKQANALGRHDAVIHNAGVKAIA